ncbi:helix-turn-helix domain-containing protein [Pontibacillus yanchengensis]|uniref:Helix-turn-helix domain-containing protein n=2 Tax=Pontibacillus yanchengensis TaxID=462910 RepID=A0A6I5A060_9BACI|nr:helix-turn-helix domain-containing protein [Pontibacillus yanchengensis]MYL52329.1 helix-turn-helix domain-containing protein [Pontibacillus yanchengensis]
MKLFILGGFLYVEKFFFHCGLTIINLIRNEHYSINEVASMYNLNWSTIRFWIHKFETLGEAGLEEAKSNTSYSKEFKLNAVKAYLSGRYSIREVVRKCGISSIVIVGFNIFHMVLNER